MSRLPGSTVAPLPDPPDPPGLRRRYRLLVAGAGFACAAYAGWLASDLGAPAHRQARSEGSVP